MEYCALNFWGETGKQQRLPSKCGQARESAAKLTSSCTGQVAAVAALFQPCTRRERIEQISRAASLLRRHENISSARPCGLLRLRSSAGSGYGSASSAGPSSRSTRSCKHWESKEVRAGNGAASPTLHCTAKQAAPIQASRHSPIARCSAARMPPAGPPAPSCAACMRPLQPASGGSMGQAAPCEAGRK